MSEIILNDIIESLREDCREQAKRIAGLETNMQILVDAEKGFSDTLRAQQERIAELEAALQEQLTFKGDNPIVSPGDFDHLLDIARRALEHKP